MLGSPASPAWPTSLDPLLNTSPLSSSNRPPKGLGAPRRSKVALARYWTRLVWFPLVCVIFSLVALQQSDAANRAGEARPRVEQVSTVTPVLSARRVPNLLALPTQAVQLQGPVLTALNGVPPDQTCAVVTNSRGVPVFEHNAGLPLSPASTQKLLLAFGVLTQFPAEHTFGTFAASDAQIINNAVQGHVWLIGTGDPVLTTQPYVSSFVEQPQVHSSLEVLADQVKATGITRIRGNILADGSRYDNIKANPTWPPRYGTDGTVGAIGALNLNRGFTSFPLAGQEWAGTGPRTAAADPAKATAEAFIELLRVRGVEVEGIADLGTVPPSPTFIGQVHSPPVGDIVGQMLRTSDNTIAEMLLKELGVVRVNKGSFEGGVAALTAILTEKGLVAPGTAIADGSGLHPGNRLPCATLNNVLMAAGRESHLAKALAVGGQSGTLQARLVGTPAAGQVFAKTGTLSNATALAGFVDTAKGQTVAFSVIVNGDGAEQFKGAEDLLVLALMNFPSGPDIATLMPKALGGSG